MRLARNSAGSPHARQPDQKSRALARSSGRVPVFVDAAACWRKVRRRDQEGGPPCQAASGTVIAQLVEAMRALAGSHPGFRPAHAKGMVCSGTFRGAPEARRVSRAPHLQGQAVPTVIRFSNASGNPDVHDGLANPRGCKPNQNFRDVYG
jgi:Catalase